MGIAALRALSASVAALLALGVAGCGGGDNGDGGIGAVPPQVGGVVFIYSSLRGAPMREKDSMVKAIRLAYDSAGGHAGPFTVKWQDLDRTTSASGLWNEEQVAADARTAARNSRTVGYIGEFDSEATKTSIPILNAAEISSISPASAYVGLTTNEDSGGPKGEPGSNYPTKERTFVRLVPRDTVQASALVATMKKDGCKKVALADDGSTYGESLGRLVHREAKDSGVAVLKTITFTSSTSAQTSATGFEEQGANCFLLAAGSATSDAARLYRTVANTLGTKARLYGTDVLCHQRSTPAAGLSASVRRRFACVLPTVPVTSSPAASQFLKAYRRRWGDGTPTPYAVYAYEAMRLYLDTIESLGVLGSSKTAVAAALNPTGERRSALGNYTIDTNGDTTSTAYGLYRVDGRGVLRYSETVRPAVR